MLQGCCSYDSGDIFETCCNSTHPARADGALSHEDHAALTAATHTRGQSFSTCAGTQHAEAQAPGPAFCVDTQTERFAVVAGTCATSLLESCSTLPLDIHSCTSSAFRTEAFRFGAVQVVHMLRGAQAPGPAFRLDTRSGRFAVVAGTHVPHLSQSSLHHLLDNFAAAATDLLRSAQT